MSDTSPARDAFARIITAHLEGKELQQFDVRLVSEALTPDHLPVDFEDIAYGEEYELRHTYVKEQAHGHGEDVIIERGPARYYRRVNKTGDI